MDLFQSRVTLRLGAPISLSIDNGFSNEETENILSIIGAAIEYLSQWPSSRLRLRQSIGKICLVATAVPHSCGFDINDTTTLLVGRGVSESETLCGRLDDLLSLVEAREADVKHYLSQVSPVTSAVFPSEALLGKGTAALYLAWSVAVEDLREAFFGRVAQAAGRAKELPVEIISVTYQALRDGQGRGVEIDQGRVTVREPWHLREDWVTGREIEAALAETARRDPLPAMVETVVARVVPEWTVRLAGVFCCPALRCSIAWHTLAEASEATRRDAVRALVARGGEGVFGRVAVAVDMMIAERPGAQRRGVLDKLSHVARVRVRYEQAGAARARVRRLKKRRGDKDPEALELVLSGPLGAGADDSAGLPTVTAIYDALVDRLGLGPDPSDELARKILPLMTERLRIALKWEPVAVDVDWPSFSRCSDPARALRPVWVNWGSLVPGLVATVVEDICQTETLRRTMAHGQLGEVLIRAAPRRRLVAERVPWGPEGAPEEAYLPFAVHVTLECDYEGPAPPHDYAELSTFLLETFPGALITEVEVPRARARIAAALGRPASDTVVEVDVASLCRAGVADPRDAFVHFTQRQCEYTLSAAALAMEEARSTLSVPLRLAGVRFVNIAGSAPGSLSVSPEGVLVVENAHEAGFKGCHPLGAMRSCVRAHALAQAMEAMTADLKGPLLARLNRELAEDVCADGPLVLGVDWPSFLLQGAAGVDPVTALASLWGDGGSAPALAGIVAFLAELRRKLRVGLRLGQLAKVVVRCAASPDSPHESALEDQGRALALVAPFGRPAPAAPVVFSDKDLHVLQVLCTLPSLADHEDGAEADMDAAEACLATACARGPHTHAYMARVLAHHCFWNPDMAETDGIAECARLVLEAGETLIKGWVVCKVSRHNADLERLLLLTTRAVHLVAYDYRQRRLAPSTRARSHPHSRSRFVQSGAFEGAPGRADLQHGVVLAYYGPKDIPAARPNPPAPPSHFILRDLPDRSLFLTLSLPSAHDAREIALAVSWAALRHPDEIASAPIHRKASLLSIFAPRSTPRKSSVSSARDPPQPPQRATIG